VLASVIAHGASSGPLAARYAAAIRARRASGDEPLPEFRGLPRTPGSGQHGLVD
jgi:hypothetical protein